MSSSAVSSADSFANMALDSREFVFSAQDFERVRKLIYARAGIALNTSKQNMVYSRLARRLRANAMRSFAAYLDWLESSAEALEWQEFVNALTTNLTSFFRESHHFPLLAEHLRRRANENELSIWCCASSTGEEPYSIAMTALDALPSHATRIKVLASDIDTNVLEVASRAEYDAERIQRIDEAMKRRHFLRGSGANAGRVRLKPAVHALVSFKRVNLLDNAWDVRGTFDAIFCRNVMIYFDKATQVRMLRKFVPLLKPGGLLFAGHSENLSHARDLFALRGKTVYERAVDVDHR